VMFIQPVNASRERANSAELFKSIEINYIKREWLSEILIISSYKRIKALSPSL
jgi:hypothetical protein